MKWPLNKKWCSKQDFLKWEYKTHFKKNRVLQKRPCYINKRIILQIDQDPSNKKSEDKAKHNKILTTYDRLLPRYGGNSGGAEKRKIEENTSSDSAIPASTSDVSKAKKLCNNTKKEYSRLKTLVPALTEREDLSKVEIIEETIRSVADRNYCH